MQIFDAHISNDAGIFAFHQRTNSNGKFLLEHALQCNLKKKREKEWTFISDMNESKSILDYILINERWRN